MKGSYILVIELPEEQEIAVGSLGAIHFSTGYYAYVGSALGGFKSRLNRHMRKDKIPKWHIDYLLQKATIQSIIICATEERVECAIAEELSNRFKSLPRFGSSDCKCPSHLFFDTREKRLREGVMMVINSVSLEGRLIK